ncbi:MAG: acyl-CoA reductase [Oscillospiraceae bacterium]|jgi:hypothetical protein|nr:acyl-CoA reductase [Oscillospiraceae bacterium]
MNLVDGKCLETADCAPIVDALPQRVLRTLASGQLDLARVLRACDRLVSSLDERRILEEMTSLGIPAPLARRHLRDARALFCEDALRGRLASEFGTDWAGRTSQSASGAGHVTERLAPLGVLLHIAAGNADGLPVFSVLEGLLTGNINILKLPAAEGGISVRILQALLAIDPLLAEYVYVFDYSSRDIENIEKLIRVSDAVVVWGGDAAVSALRRLVPPNTKLIEWGHKVSFAYVTPSGVTPANLSGLADNIAETHQLLCSSCQGLFLDTDDMSAVYALCETFLPVLETALARLPCPAGTQAGATLERYTANLAAALGGPRVFHGALACLAAWESSTLESAPGFGHAWVRRLPRCEVLSALRLHKGHLQTAALLCADEERDALATLLFKAGAVRVTTGARMSRAYGADAPRDGERALRRYMKMTTVEGFES